MDPFVKKGVEDASLFLKVRGIVYQPDLQRFLNGRGHGPYSGKVLKELEKSDNINVVLGGGKYRWEGPRRVCCHEKRNVGLL